MWKTSKLFFWALAALLVLWQIPSCYNFFAVKPADAPFTLYSPVIGDFAMLRFDEEKRMRYTDASGREYTKEQFDSILPAFYCRQLVADGRFPDSICGRAVTLRQIQKANFNLRLSPSNLNAPQVGLQQLMESMSGRVDLTLPDDVFRITDTGIEFVRMETNQIDEEKSARFTEAMKRKGFHFPACRISGNPTARKEYDEGYVMLDAARRLFHVKQTVGRPYVRAIELPEGLVPEYLFITEFPSRRWLCFLTDTGGGFWVVERDSYAVVRTELPSFDPREESMLIFGNLFDWTVKVDRGGEKCFYALSAEDYTLLDSLTIPTPDRSWRGLRFTSPKDKFVKPRF